MAGYFMDVEFQKIWNELYYQIGMLCGLEEKAEVDYSIEKQVEKREVAYELSMEHQSEDIDLFYKKENEGKFYERITAYEKLLSEVMNVQQETVLNKIELLKEHPEYAKDALVFSAAICYYLRQVAELGDGNERQLSIAVNNYLKSCGMISKSYIPFGKYIRKAEAAIWEETLQQEAAEQEIYWLKVYMQAMLDAVQKENNFLKKVLELRRREPYRIEKIGKVKPLLHRIFVYMSEFPVFDVKGIARDMEVSFNTAAKAVSLLEEAQVINMIHGRQRYRIYAYAEYLNVLKEL